MSRANIEAVLDGFTLGEGPHWVEEKQELLLVDILKQSVHRYVPGTGEHYQIPTGENASVVVPVEGQSSQYIVGVGSNLVCLDWDGKSKEAKSTRTIKSIPKNSAKVVLNDGKCDPLGRFWVGSIGMSETGLSPNSGNLFSLELDGEFKTHVNDISTANGLAWTSDSSRFFYIDSTKYTVDVFDFDSYLGTLSNRRVLYDFKKHGTEGLPDGMTIDSQNNIWVACYMGAQVLHIDTTTGVVLDSIDFSGRTSLVTSVTFGGPHLDTLYVTSGTFIAPDLVLNHVVTEEKEGGALFKVTNIGAKGTTAVNYKGKLQF